MSIQPTKTVVSPRNREGFDNFMRTICNKWYSDNDKMLNAYNRIQCE